MKPLIFILLTFAVSACDRILPDSYSKLETFAQKNRVGNSSDVWLELDSLNGEWDKVALVTGYFDDMEGCTDIAELLEQNFGRRYRCTYAN